MATSRFAGYASPWLISVDSRIVAGVKQNVALVTKGMMGGLAWPGLLRKLDRESPGYKD